VQFTVTHTYEHPVEVVFAALTDLEMVTAKYEAVGQRDVTLVRRDEGEDGSLTLATSRTVPLEVPGFAKKVLSPTQTVIQTDEWAAADADGGRRGTFTVEAKGAPVKVQGTLHLAPNGHAACTNTSVVDIECRVPLIGGRVADFVAKDTKAAVAHEESWLNEQLGGARGG
jgi:hypothetical protein